MRLFAAVFFVAAPMVGCDDKGSGAADAGQVVDGAESSGRDGGVEALRGDAGAHEGGVSADTNDPIAKRLDDALIAVIGPEPRLETVKATEPWPDCATGVVRVALQGEMARLEAIAAAKNKAALAIYTPLKAAWAARKREVLRVAENGFYLSPSPNAAKLETFPDVGKDVKVILNPESPIAAELRAELSKTGETTSFACAEDNITKIEGHSFGVLEAAARDKGYSNRYETYIVFCNGYRVIAERLSAWATISSSNGKSLIAGYQYVSDRPWSPALKGRVFTLAMGSQLKITGAKKVTFIPRSARREVSEWMVEFEPACAHEGLGCTFDDGLPAPSIALEGASCTAPLLAQKDAWLAAVDTGNAGAAAEPMLSMLNVLTGGAPDVRKRLADQLLKSKRYPELVALLVEQKDAAGLQALADAQQKADQPRTVVLAYEGLRKLKGDDADVLLQLGAAYLETQAKPKALETLHLAAELKANDAAYQKQVGLLLGVAGDKVGANSALFKACSAGDAEACKPAK